MKRTKLWLDCEWNDWGGELISIALVDAKDNVFYSVLPCPNPTEWVRANVMPVLGGKTKTLFYRSRDKKQLQEELEHFLSAYSDVEIIADWPEDIRWFCDLLIAGPGKKIPHPNLQFTLVDLNYESAIPHNALEDAKAIRDSYLKNKKVDDA